MLTLLKRIRKSCGSKLWVLFPVTGPERAPLLLKNCFWRKDARSHFGAGSGKCSLWFPAQSRHLVSPLPQGLEIRGTVHQHEVSQRRTFYNHSPQRRKWTTLPLNNVQRDIPTKPPPFFLGKCKVSCGLFTNLGEDEMSAVTEFPGFIPRTSPPYYYLQWHFGY